MTVRHLIAMLLDFELDDEVVFLDEKGKRLFPINSVIDGGVTGVTNDEGVTEYEGMVILSDVEQLDLVHEINLN